MGEQKDLSKKEAVEKIRDIVDNNKTALLMTNLSKHPINTRPMTTQEVDEDGNLWFLCDVQGEYNQDIKADPHVQVTYANENKYEYLSVYGAAEITMDRDKIHKYWNNMAKAWFDGKDDPRLRVMKVKTKEAFYWDTKHNTLVSLMKILGSAVSNKKMDDGISGNLNT